MPDVNSAPVALRPAGPADAEFLYAVYAHTRYEELAATGWTAEQTDAFLRMQFRAQDIHYRAHYAGASFDVIEVDGEPAGRLYVHRVPGDIRIVDIALLPAFRGRGVGTKLIHELFAEADASGDAVSIHVEPGNPARRLYARLGFVTAGQTGLYERMDRPPAG